MAKLVTVRFPDTTPINIPKGTTVAISSGGTTPISIGGGEIMAITDLLDDPMPSHSHPVTGTAGP